MADIRFDIKPRNHKQHCENCKLQLQKGKQRYSIVLYDSMATINFCSVKCIYAWVESQVGALEQEYNENKGLLSRIAKATPFK